MEWWVQVLLIVVGSVIGVVMGWGTERIGWTPTRVIDRILPVLALIDIAIGGIAAVSGDVLIGFCLGGVGAILLSLCFCS